MQPINPDDPKALKNFLIEWSTYYTSRNPVDPPTIDTLRDLWAYYEEGSIPGSLAMAVLKNDLYEVYSVCLQKDLHTIYGTVQYVVVAFPTSCYGSAEKVGKYVEQKKRDKSGKRTRIY